MKFSIKDFFSTADLVTLTEEILNGKLHFLCSDITSKRIYDWELLDITVHEVK